MRIYARVSAASAIRSKSNHHGTIGIEIDPAALADRQRETLALLVDECSSSSSNDAIPKGAAFLRLSAPGYPKPNLLSGPASITAATHEAMAAHLDAVAEAQDAHAAKLRAQAEEQAKLPVAEQVEYHYCRYQPIKPLALFPDLAGPAQAEADRLNAEAQEAYRDRQRREAEERAEADRKRIELEAAKRALARKVCEADDPDLLDAFDAGETSHAAYLATINGLVAVAAKTASPEDIPAYDEIDDFQAIASVSPDIARAEREARAKFLARLEDIARAYGLPKPSDLSRRYCDCRLDLAGYPATDNSRTNVAVQYAFEIGGIPFSALVPLAVHPIEGDDSDD